ncbi:MAG: SDR family oxidoreductase [Planctomycetaceae bacterium]
MLDSFNDRWALVTGASSGIGAEFAARLAGRGMHLILAARRSDAMNALAQELNTRHGTKCHIVSIDLSLPDSGKRLADEVQKLGVQVELLVNNAGVGMIGDIETTSPEEVRRMLTLNILTLTDLTYRLLPGMLDRRHGAIINLSSVAAFQPVAFMAAYSASKSYVLHFSEALWAEARSRGVTVLAVCPGATETEFFDRAGAPGWLSKHTSVTPQRVVRKSLRALERRRQYIIPDWKNYLLSILVRLATRRTAVNESKRYFRPGKRRPDDNAAPPSESQNPGSDGAA